MLADEKVIGSICMTVLTYVFGIFQLSIYAFISDLFTTCAAKLCLVYAKSVFVQWKVGIIICYYISIILASFFVQYCVNFPQISYSSLGWFVQFFCRPLLPSH